jgi:hypothetical protein
LLAVGLVALMVAWVLAAAGLVDTFQVRQLRQLRLTLSPLAAAALLFLEIQTAITVLIVPYLVARQLAAAGAALLALRAAQVAPAVAQVHMAMAPHKVGLELLGKVIVVVAAVTVSIA